MRRLLLVLLVLCAALSGAGVASAETATPAGKDLPKGFPAELRQFVAGTDEFKQAPWFTDGMCADRGGDLGAYMAAMFPVEDRLLYWQLPDADKLAVWSGGVAAGPAAAEAATDAQKAVDAGTEPPKDKLPSVFPAGDGSFTPPVGMYCADDMKAWGVASSSNAWGFAWAKTADQASKDKWNELPNADEVPNGAWADPCGTPELPGIYCMHAYFADCDQVKGTESYDKCMQWNQVVGKLSVGTAHWFDQHRGALDRVPWGTVAKLALVPALMAGNPVAGGMAALWAVAPDAVKDFVENATNPLDKLVNRVHEAAVSFTTAVLENIAETGTFDPKSGAFATKYWQAAALGMVLMAFMMLHTMSRVGRHGSPGDAWVAVGVWMPWAMTAQLIAPGLAAILLSGVNALAKSLAAAAGQDISGIITGIQSVGAMQAPTFPGSSFIGLLLFLAMIVGAVALWAGQQMHRMGMWILGPVVALSFGLWVSPKYRHKAMRPVMVFFAIACSKALVFLLLGAVFASAGEAFTTPSTGPMDAFNRVAYAVIAMLVAGFGVWKLVKWIPFLPSQDDTQDVGGSGPAMTAGVVGGVGAGMMYLSSPRGRSGSGANGQTGTGQDGQGGSPGQSSSPGQGPVAQAWQARGGAPSAGAAGAAGSVGKAAKIGGSAGAGVATAGASVALQAITEVAKVGVHRAQSAGHRPVYAEDTPDEKGKS